MEYVLSSIGDLDNISKKCFLADTVNDLILIDTSNLNLGDQCYVIASREYYLVNSNKNWQLIGTTTAYTPVHVEPDQKIKDLSNGSYIQYHLDDNYNITDINIVKMEAIPKYAFFSQSLLSSVIIPEGTKEIQDYAFQNCKQLNSVSLPKSLTKIGYNSFAFCNNLTSITINSNLNSLSRAAFSSCENLKDIYVPWKQWAIADAPWGATNATIHYES